MQNPLSKIVTFDDDEEFYLLSRVFLQIPFEYGFSGIVGKQYQATKDFLKWNNFKVKKWVSIVLQMGIVWANEINSKSNK